MESKADTAKRAQATELGRFELTLVLDPGSSAHVTRVQQQSSAERVAREVPLVIGSLLFAQQQMRAINDPSRFAALDEIDEACRAAREGGLAAPVAPANGRAAATYQVALLANGGFRINVDEKLAGIISDVSGGLAAGALAAELLTTLREPYRTFYREMLEAATTSWRERRPLVSESTWVWTLALRRLDQLVRQGVENLGPPQVCVSCQALRPAGFPCLHCETRPGETGVAQTATASVPPVAVETASTTPADVPEPVPETPGETAGSVTVTPPPAPEPRPATTAVESAPPAPRPESPAAAATAQGERESERTIVPAREIPPPAHDESSEPKPVTLAGLLARGAALLIDLVIAIAVGGLGGFGLTMVLLAFNAFSPTDDPQQFASAAATAFFALYFILGWTGGETFGMLIFRIQVVQEESRKRCGLFHAVGRGFGYFVLVALGVAVFYIGNEIDNNVLAFIPSGTPTDDAIRVIVGLIALYVLWLGSGQRILSDPFRRTWADKIGKTLVISRKRAAQPNS